MINRSVVALFVACLLSLPALAQQQPASSTPSDQSSQAASTQTTNSGETATGKAPLQYESRQGFWGKVNPFARKKYVQRQTQPIRDRVNELDELTSANSKMIKDVDSRSQQGIQMASNKANEADQHAVDAGNKATKAQTTAENGEKPKRMSGGRVEVSLLKNDLEQLAGGATTTPQQ